MLCLEVGQHFQNAAMVLLSSSRLLCLGNPNEPSCARTVWIRWGFASGQPADALHDTRVLSMSSRLFLTGPARSALPWDISDGVLATVGITAFPSKIGDYAQPEAREMNRSVSVSVFMTCGQQCSCYKSVHVHVMRPSFTLAYLSSATVWCGSACCMCSTSGNCMPRDYTSS